MLAPIQKQALLNLVKESIGWGLRYGKPLPVKLQDFDSELQQPGTCFVTLRKNNDLRGCIGSIEVRRPLLEDVIKNAYAAAFHDPRFDPLQAKELEFLSLSISVLTPASEMDFDSEPDLIQQIRPGIDGLILQQGCHRATFLPSVWRQLPDPTEFMRKLKQKAGLPAYFWSDDICVSRYQTESFS